MRSAKVSCVTSSAAGQERLFARIGLPFQGEACGGVGPKALPSAEVGEALWAGDWPIVRGLGMKAARECPLHDVLRECCRANAKSRRGVGCGEWSADWKSAIQQVRNLRYEEAAHALLETRYCAANGRSL